MPVGGKRTQNAKSADDGTNGGKPGLPSGVGKHPMVMRLINSRVNKKCNC
jgi:hypothetical protein|tara:strand:- start:478 stop:627 length:150 start_codon:yes stop_codon:yes gene_type:complete